MSKKCVIKFDEGYLKSSNYTIALDTDIMEARIYNTVSAAKNSLKQIKYGIVDYTNPRVIEIDIFEKGSVVETLTAETIEDYFN